MTRTGLVLALFVPSAVLAEPAAPALETGSETIVVIDRAPDADAARDRDRALGDAPFVTIVHPDDHPATASVADAIGATVGAQTRALGGLGAYESILVRGAAPGHTEVLIDGVPLARLAAVTTDLGRFTLSSFGQVELYRGAVPVELGGAGVGGALNLVTRLGRGEHGERITASIGGGSFGAAHLRAHYGDAHLDGRVKSSTTIGFQRATGDYTYFSDNGTSLNRNDDTYKTRANNGFSQLDLASRAGMKGTSGGVRFAWKHQGLPGSVQQPSATATLGTLDVLADGRGDVPVGPAIARELGYILIESQHLRDSLGELGLGAQARDYVTISGGASSTWIAAVGRHRAVAGVELRADQFRDSDSTGASGNLSGDREGGAALAAIDVVLDPDATIVVTPAIRYDVVRTNPTPLVAGPEAFMPVPVRRDHVPSPRITARAAATPQLSIKGSAGWYVRLPTLLELFGDRGSIFGNPNLRPERGPSADAGFVWAPAHARGDVDRIMVEAAGFATRSHDTITLVPTAGFATRAANVADALSYGSELVASLRIARLVSITANYTRLVTAQIDANPALANKLLPRQPGHHIYGRGDAVRRLRGHLATLWLDGSWQSDAYLDQANLQVVPARLLLGTGARVEIGRDVAIAVSVENLADLRVLDLPLVPPPRPDLTTAPTAFADVAGFPLPGRSFYLSVEWSHR